MCVRYTALCDVFFFKQKTAYEMRISDWSSDVCSSDLLELIHGFLVEEVALLHVGLVDHMTAGDGKRQHGENQQGDQLLHACCVRIVKVSDEIGRASCRERVCQYV